MTSGGGRRARARNPCWRRMACANNCPPRQGLHDARDSRSAMTELIHHYGGWVVFWLVFLEAVGLPLPGETILVSAAIYAGTTQNIGIGLVLIAGILGATLGSFVGFAIGRRYGYPLLLGYGGYIGLTETRLKIGQYLFQRYGIGLVLTARFVAFFRSLLSLVAGANRMPFANFAIASTAGGIVWVL